MRPHLLRSTLELAGGAGLAVIMLSASIGYDDSPAVETVTPLLMVAGTLNFLTAWAVMQGRFKVVSRNGEVRLQAVVLPLTAILLAVTLGGAVYSSAGKTVRVAVFEAVRLIPPRDSRRWVTVSGRFTRCLF